VHVPIYSAAYYSISFTWIFCLVGAGLICILASYALTAWPEYRRGPRHLAQWWHAQRAGLADRSVIAGIIRAVKWLTFAAGLGVLIIKGKDALLGYIEFAGPFFGAIILGDAIKSRLRRRPFRSDDFRVYFYSVIASSIGFLALLVHNHSTQLDFFAVLFIAACCLWALIQRHLNAEPRRQLWQTPKDALATIAIFLITVAFLWLVFNDLCLWLASLYSQ